MNVNAKQNLIFLIPGPDFQPNSKLTLDRFTMLSDKYQGRVLTWVYEKKFTEVQMGEFVYQGFFCQSAGVITRVRLLLFMIRNAAVYAKKKQVDAVICYDATFTGIVGVILKFLLRSKLIIEVNSNDADAALKLEKGNNIHTKFKSFIFRMLRKVSLSHADGVKLLPYGETDATKKKMFTAKIFSFHDFVPTHFFFDSERKFDKYVLSVGYPFYRKGIDILIKAFDSVSKKYPEFKLKLIGHWLYEDALEHVKAWKSDIEFIKPMFYDDLHDEFLNCYCFVLPSREEGMGRVILEAMAAGKPIIGSNTGGIPYLVKDGGNGYLFDSCDVSDLAEKLERILSNPGMAKNMGDNSRELISQKFSSGKYLEKFDQMICSLLKKEN